MVVRKKTSTKKAKPKAKSKATRNSMPVKKKASTSNSKANKTSKASWEKKVALLHKENENLQKQINKAKKEYETLERRSLELTKKLFEAGYIPKTSFLKS